MKPARLLTSALVTALGLVVLASLSAFPVSHHREDAARLRLSWSARPERIETCRPVSPEEQARREEHMRQSAECEGRFATYELRVEVDQQLTGTSLIRGAGLRHDRPLYLLRDYPVPPGRHQVRVTLTRRETTDDDAAAYAPGAAPAADSGLFAGRPQREAAERARRARAAIPARLVLDTTLTFTARRVALVTFNAEQRSLELHGGRQ